MQGTTKTPRSASLVSIDDPQFAAQVRAGEPAALQTVVHAYLGQILLRLNFPEEALRVDLPKGGVAAQPPMQPAFVLLCVCLLTISGRTFPIQLVRQENQRRYDNHV